MRTCGFLHVPKQQFPWFRNENSHVYVYYLYNICTYIYTCISYCSAYMESGFPLPKVTGEIPQFRTMASLYSTLAQPCSTPLRLKLASTKADAMVGGPSSIMPSIQDRLCHMWWFTCTSEVMNKIEWSNKNTASCIFMSIALPATFQVKQILPAKISLQMLPNASQLLSLFTSAACFTSSSTPAAELQVPTNGCPSRFVAFGSEPHLFDMLFMIPSNAPYRILIGWLFFSAFKLDLWCYMIAFPFPRCFTAQIFFLDPFFGEVRSSSNAAIVSMPPAEVLCAAARCNGVQSSDSIGWAARPHVDTCRILSVSIWVFLKTVVPQNGWFIMENPIKMDDFWGENPPFLEPPISCVVCAFFFEVFHALNAHH